MQQKWWLAAAGLVGLALAVLLFPKPASEDLPEPDRTRANPLDFKAQSSNKKPNHVKVARREALPPDVMAMRASRMVGMEHLTTPEAIFAGRLSGPWTLVRRQLLAQGDADAKAWAETITPVVTDLRNRRRDPDAVAWDDLRARQDALLAELKGHPTWVGIEGVAPQIDRIEDLMVGYEQARAAADAKAAGKEPLPAPAGDVTVPAKTAPPVGAN